MSEWFWMSKLIGKQCKSDASDDGKDGGVG